MPDSTNLEFQNRPPEKLSIGDKIRNAAESLKNKFFEVVESAKVVTKQVVERAWYSHSSTMFALESLVFDAMLIANKGNPTKILIGGVGTLLKNSLGLSTMVEDLKVNGGKSIDVGEHMKITTGKLRGTKEPRDVEGEVLKPGDKIGIISVTRNLNKMQENDNLIAKTRELYRSTELSLTELAKLCEENDPRLKDINFFRGQSHLAGPLAERLGFDIYEIANPFERFSTKLAGKLIVKGHVGKNVEWKKFEVNYNDPKEAIISRKKLIELYGSGNPIDNPNN